VQLHPCKFRGFLSSVDQDSTLLGYHNVLTGK
jgi:hypothetical protein